MIAPNAVSTGFMNEFVEVILGSCYSYCCRIFRFGLIQNAGFGMAFQTMPYLFEQWGSTCYLLLPCLLVLIVFSGITSSLAMRTPWMGFMRDEFGWSKIKGAWSFGAMILVLGLPTVIFLRKECLMNMIIGVGKV
jgi:SNF family Na+-dependent transporter